MALVRDGVLLVMSVTDNGKGFDVANGRRRGGLGLVSMEERARLARGQATVRSRPGETIVEVIVPIEPEPEDAPYQNPGR